MRTIFAMFLLAAASDCASSTPVRPLWDSEWRLMLGDGHCFMMREYHGSPGFELEVSGENDQPEIGGFRLQFAIYSDLERDTVQFYKPGNPYLILTGGIEPSSRQEQLKIKEARIGSSHFIMMGQVGVVYMFYLEEDNSKRVFDALSNDERVDLVLILGSGESVNLRVPSLKTGQFNVWARMLEVCARENVI